MGSINRNDKCFCGSGLKYKKCCIDKENSNSKSGIKDEFDLNIRLKEAILNAKKSQKHSKKNSFISSCNEYSTAKILNTLVGLQLISKNHGKNLRIEIMAKEAMKRHNKSSNFNYTQLVQNIEESYPSYHMEDPPENLFTENVLFHGGNYTFMPGIVTKGGDVFKSLTEAIFLYDKKMPKDFKDEIYQGVSLILELGQRILKKGNIHGNIFEQDIDKKLIFQQDLIDYSTPLNEISEICLKNQIATNVFESFILKGENVNYDSNNDEENPLLYQPLVVIDGYCHFPLISAQGLILIEFIYNTAIKYECTKELLEKYSAVVWSECMQCFEKIGYGIINLGGGSGYKEAFLKFDFDKTCYVNYAYPTTLTSRSDSFKVEESDENELPYHKRANEVISGFYKEKINTNELLVLYLNSQNGRDGSSIFDRAKYSEEIVWFGTFDFINLAYLENWNPLSLYKYAKVYRLANNRSKFFNTDPMDFYSLYKSKDESFYFDDNSVPGLVSLMPGLGSHLYREAKLKKNQSGILFSFNNNLGYQLVESYREYKSIFKPSSINITNLLYLDVCMFPIWIGTEDERPEREEFSLIIIEAICFWLDKMKNGISNHFNQLTLPVFTIIVKIDDYFFEKHYSSEKLFDSEDTEFRSEHTDAKLTLFIPRELLGEFRGPNNRGERKLLSELLIAFSKIESVQLTKEEIEIILNQYMPLSSAKMILLMDSNGDVRVDPNWLYPPLYISKAEIGILLDNLVKIINYPTTIPKEIKDKAEKVKFINYIVIQLLSQIESKLERYDNEDLLRNLLQLNERLTFKREYDKVIVPAQIICFENKSERIVKLIEEQKSVVNTSLSTRCLIEYIAAKPTKGENKIGLNELDELLTIMHEVINYGFLSDSINYDMSNPEMGLLDSGRVGISHEYLDDKLKPYQSAKISDDVDNYIEDFEDNFIEIDKDTKNSAEVDRYYDKVDDAFTKDWAISLTNLIDLLRYLVSITYMKESSINCIEINELVDSINRVTGMPKEQITNRIKLLSLTKREDYLKAPDGYKNEDVFPWKYNREFSLIRRPLVIYENSGKEYVIWGMRNVENSAQQITGLFGTGRLKYTGNNIKVLLGERVKENGKKFRNRVIEWFKNNTNLKLIDFEVKIATNGHLKADKDYGDIDIFALDIKNKILYNIECKRTHQAKNIHEMKTELDNYLGRDGKNNKIQKHIERHKWLTNNKSIIAEFAKLDSVKEIKSFIISSEIIPIVYLKKEELPLPIFSFKEIKNDCINIIENVVN